MNFCFKLGAMTLVAIGLQGASLETPPKRVTTVVRADARSGRLVRSVAVASRTVPEKVVSPAPPPPPAVPNSQPEAGATGHALGWSIARRSNVGASLAGSLLPGGWPSQPHA